jgi:purine-binding chemotaxis protein CheW
VINLRGHVIPVVDLRNKFGMETAQVTDASCIVVAETSHRGRKQSTGLIVDRVSEVLKIPMEQIEESPGLSAGGTADFILGIAKVGSTVKILLNIDRVLASDDVIPMEGVLEQGEAVAA